MSAAVRWLTTRWLRRRWLAVAPLALAVAIGTAGAMASLGAAQRTSTAYRDFLDRADVGDVILNPSISTKEIDEVIRSLPGVDVATSHSMFTVTEDDGEPRTPEEVDGANNSFAFVMGSSDGKFTDTDRPAVQSGRMATGPNEAVLTVEAAEASDLVIGDVLTLSFWQPGITDGLAGEELERYRSQRIDPVGVEKVEIVGVVTLADEVLPDDLYPRSKVIVSPDVAARYDCLPAAPTPGSTFAQYVAALLPADCAVQYRYYSLSFRNGAAGVKPALEEFLRISTQLNIGLTDISDLDTLGVTEPPQYFLIPTETVREQDRVERSVRPTVTALGMLGIAAGLVTVALAGLVAAREIRRSRPDLRQWQQLGLGTSARATVVSAPLVVATVVGLVVGVTAGWLLDVGPVGLVRAVEPHPDRQLTSVALLAAMASAVGVMLVIAVLSWRAARRPNATLIRAVGRRSVLGLAARTGSPVVADGVRAAYGQRAAVPVLAGCAVLTGGFVAAAVFGASLTSLLSTPRSYGWPWDVAIVTGFGYGDLDLEAAQRLLDDDPNVESWTALGFLNEVSLAGEPMMTVIGLERITDVDLPVITGRLPVEKDEVALGTTTASDRGLSVGDSVEVGGAFEPITVTVSGIVVFPSVGPVLADRVSTGTGLLLPQALFDNADLQYLASEAVGLATFVGVDLREDADPAAVVDLEEQLASLDLLGIPAFPYSDPVRPPEIVDARSTRTVPTVVGLVFAATAALGLAFASWASTRSRRRDLAVLRTLGFSRVQLRRSVRIQSLATLLVALVVGVPLGVVAGRVLWQAFAEELGVVPDPVSPFLTVSIAIGGGFVLAMLAAQIPAYLAGRRSPAEGLRTE